MITRDDFTRLCRRQKWARLAAQYDPLRDDPAPRARAAKMVLAENLAIRRAVERPLVTEIRITPDVVALRRSDQLED